MMRIGRVIGACLFAISATAQGAGWQSTPAFEPPFHIVADGQDMGARFADLNGDGRVDFLYFRYFGSGSIQKGAYLSTGSGWQYAAAFVPPFHFVANGQDMGARLVDVNNDGLVDLLFHRYYSGRVQAGAYLNTGTGWQSAPAFTPPFHIVGDGQDMGARFADLNGDGRADFVYHRYFGGQVQKGAYLSTASGWQYAPEFVPPYHIVGDGKDMGVRLVDANGDGRIDFLYNRYYLICGGARCEKTESRAYLSTDTGWLYTPSFAPPYHTVASGQDTGARFADVNGDGRDDFLYHRYFGGGQVQKGAYLNTAPPAP